MISRTAAWTFAVLFAAASAGLYFGARTIRSGSADWGAMARSAESRGETDLGLRLRIKDVYYAGRPASAAAESLEGAAAPDVLNYLRAIEAIRAGRAADAESSLSRVAESSRSPLLAARARARLDQFRYGSSLPKSGEIPY
ncbi:hypothetical protein HY522_09080 [bacterium]|nr:hypothetical protein [bacterium]